MAHFFIHISRPKPAATKHSLKRRHSLKKANTRPIANSSTRSQLSAAAELDHFAKFANKHFKQRVFFFESRRQG